MLWTGPVYAMMTKEKQWSRYRYAVCQVFGHVVGDQESFGVTAANIDNMAGACVCHSAWDMSASALFEFQAVRNVSVVKGNGSEWVARDYNGLGAVNTIVTAQHPRLALKYMKEDYLKQATPKTAFDDDPRPPAA